MRATIEFNLPEEAVEYKIFNNSSEMYSTLVTLREILIKVYNKKMECSEDVIERMLECVSNIVDKIE
jgi:hypothetical protein